jgi:hypothetical protein
VSKYVTPSEKRIIKTTTLYADNKTQVPKEVVEMLKLQLGTQIVWMKENNRIYVESATLG